VARLARASGGHARDDSDDDSVGGGAPAGE
jgi:hypothetical protein